MNAASNRTGWSRLLIAVAIIALAVLGLNRYRHAQLHNAECMP
jgi:hypothetical protein